jgi:hypothetical protein
MRSTGKIMPFFNENKRLATSRTRKALPTENNVYIIGINALGMF